ncbi:MAG: hypothetical protein HYX51_00975 [Chloroflexi bacterium]|nr:hypothetical protein [Chloroflexota bacterium]
MPRSWMLAVVGCVVLVAIGGLLLVVRQGWVQPSAAAESGPAPPGGRAVGAGVSATPPAPQFASLSAAVVAGVGTLGSHALSPGQAAALVADTELVLGAIADETSLTFEDIALRKHLRLPKGLASGTDAQRLSYWKDTTDYFRNLDVDITSAVIRVRNSKGREVAGPVPGRAFSMRTTAPDEVRSTKPIYEVVFTGIARTGKYAGQAIRYGLWMVQDVPDGSWRLCGVSHYDVPPEGEPRPVVPIAYPPK